MSNKEIFKRVRFCARGEEDVDLLIERTGIVIYDAQRISGWAATDSIVLLDESAGEDDHARAHFGTFDDWNFPGIERWPLAKWGQRILVAANSGTDLEVIGFAEIDVEAGIVTEQPASTRPLVTASTIKVREGTYGPKHDPYSYTEWTVTLGADTWIVHIGLGDWLKLNGARIAPKDGDIDAALSAAGCPLSLRQIKRYHRRIKAAPQKIHKAHGGMREADGMPGETLLICKCGAVLSCDFNISEII